MSYEKKIIFPTLVYIKKIGTLEYNNYLQQKILEWKKNSLGIVKSNVKGWHSTSDMHKKDEYKHLINEILFFSKEIFEENFYDFEPSIGNMWANINFPDSLNLPHIHGNCLYSGVYYIKVPKNSGKLIFDDPRPVSEWLTIKKKINEEYLPMEKKYNYSIEPIEGNLIIFPSWLRHSVLINNSDNIRMSVSFNVIYTSERILK